MPYADPANRQRPYAPHSETSQEGAQKAEESAPTQRVRMAAIYRSHAFLGGVTDHEMVDLSGYKMNIVNARRNDLGCVSIGKRMGPCGVNVAAWVLPEDTQ